MTWWWLWDGFVLAISLIGLSDNISKGRTVEAVMSTMFAGCALLRVLSSYGAW